MDVFEEAEEAAERAAPRGTHEVATPRNRAFLVGVTYKRAPRGGSATLSIEESIEELAQLATTAGLEVVGRTFQRLEAPDSKSYVGSGKLLELADEARSLGADTLLFNDELRPSQARNVERIVEGVRVCDRFELILDVFRQRAATREGWLQVQLARVMYQMPRTTKLWQHLDRQSGGGGAAVKGMGERQLEIDKRLLREQAARIREKLESVRTHRAVHRLRRASAPVPVVALCGYTSAGKSTLLNTVSGADVLTDAALFSTLDPTTRRATIPGGPTVLFTDTVGFVERLPTQLVAAFRATLEELSEATLIVHVVDASRSNFQPHVTAVEGVLAQLDGVDAVPILMVWNKVDLAADPEALRLRAAQETTPTVCVSALTGEGLPDFWDAVLRFIEEETLVSINLLLPLELGSDVLARIRACGGVVDVEDWASGASVSVAAQVPPSLAGLLRPYRIAFGDDLQSAGGNRYNSRELP